MDVDDSTIAFDLAVGSFRLRCDEYRRRIQAGGADLSCNEAIDAYRLMTPCFAPEPDQDLAKKRASMNAIIGMCMEPAIGGFCFREPAIQSIIEGFEKEIDDGIETLYVRHHGEKEAREVSRWERYIAYCSLRFFVAHSPSGDLPHLQERAEAILDTGTVDRPQGRYDARTNALRDCRIWICLDALDGCGLPVTSRDETNSLAYALACATDISVRAIVEVWEKAPAEFRSDKRSRDFFATGVPCDKCRQPKVPKFRAERNLLLCYACRPPLL